MSHVIKEKKKLLARVGRIRGQVEAIERALTDEAECERIMHMIAGIRGSVAGLMAEVVEDHVHNHLVDTAKHPHALNAEAAEQLLDGVPGEYVARFQDHPECHSANLPAWSLSARFAHA